MSGNTNDPLAPDSYETPEQIIQDILESNRSASELSPTGELLRAIQRFQQQRRTRNEGLPDMPPNRPARRSALAPSRPARRSALAPSRPPQAEGSEPERRTRPPRNSQDASPLFVLPPQPSISDRPPRQIAASRLAAMNARRGRTPRMSLGDRFVERRSEALENITPSRGLGNGLADLQQAGLRLEAASSSLRALLDDPVPEISSPPLEPRHYPEEADYNRRAKRRKLDSDNLDPGFKGFSYGRYGQVEPGKLKMEIVSCDGGIFDHHSGNYAAENVLRGDDTVYCTKSNRCNLILQHQGATVFSLKELVIKAPHSGYTAPVQEGMIFVSMTSDDILTRTAQYQIQYSPARPRRSSSLDHPPIMSIRHNDDGTMSTAQARARRLYNIGLNDEDCEFRTAQIPPDFTENAPPFRVTTECSDSETEQTTTHHSRLGRLHALHRATLDLISSDEEEDGLNHNRDSRSPGPRRRETASNITLAEAAEASQIATQEAVRAVGGELMAPHARFFIERDKSKCTVKFDPPVSGRFILLKMWSPHHSPPGNIDIQSVVAKGFAGPRYFPAVSFR